MQVDTAHVVLHTGFRFKHFTACDVFSRWQVLEAHSRATAHAAAGFLDTVITRMPFPIRAIQADGGSEFMTQFEVACRERASASSSSRLALPTSTGTSKGPSAHTEGLSLRNS